MDLELISHENLKKKIKIHYYQGKRKILTRFLNCFFEKSVSDVQ